MDFIYYALGGELKEWRKEASLADSVVASLSFGGVSITVRREVDAASFRPMDIFFGSYDEALASAGAGWQRFGYRRLESEFSFSQVLFRAMGIPESVGGADGNVTMHQLLRVIYSDQMTPIQRIFRIEPFDTWQVRDAVGDVLCGIGGYEIYGLRIELRSLDKRYKIVADELKSLLTVASAYESVLPEHVEAALEVAQKRRAVLQADLDALLLGADEQTSDPKVDPEQQKSIRRRLASARRNVDKIESDIDVLEYELRDAEKFIDHLKDTLSDFEDAASTFSALGQVKFEFCPSCFSETRAVPAQDECHLCGGERQAEVDGAKSLAVRLDLEMQIRESLQLQDERECRLNDLKRAKRVAAAGLKAAANEASSILAGAMNRYEAQVSEMSRQIGFLDSEVIQLSRRESLSLEIRRLSGEKSELNAKISDLKARIDLLEYAQVRRRAVVAELVQKNVKYLLSMDLEQHSDFGEIDTFSFDFSSDLMVVNGDADRVGSASGMVVLKNSFLLSLFMASLEDGEFNLPKFMLMDNIEDKGMVQERSWNFQRLIVEASQASGMDNQIIFTTSKIAPEYEGGDFVVGRKYTKLNPTLAIR